MNGVTLSREESIKFNAEKLMAITGSEEIASAIIDEFIIPILDNNVSKEFWSDIENEIQNMPLKETSDYDNYIKIKKEYREACLKIIDILEFATSDTENIAKQIFEITKSYNIATTMIHLFISKLDNELDIKRWEDIQYRLDILFKETL